jgi:signal transduction histidine kinase
VEDLTPRPAFRATMRGMTSRLVQRVTIRTALRVGFGLTIGLWFFAGYQVTLRMRDTQRDAAAANARYMQAQELLASVRTQVLVASVLVRDALLDPGPAFVADHRQEISRAYVAIDSLLARYVPFLDSPAERERVTRLRDEIREFRSASDDVLATDSTRWPSDARVLLRRFMPKREAAIRVSEEVQSLNRLAFVDQQRKISEMQAGAQRQVWTMLGVALAISLAIGGLASRHATRLERRLTEQHLREERIAADLHRLSARLVQVQEDEQRRIARELHDEVGQALSAVKVELAVAQRHIERMRGPVDWLAAAQMSADSALRSVRDLSHLLHPSALEDLGLVAALESHIADVRRRHHAAIEFVQEGLEVRQTVETERAVYRVVQEALTNVARHSQATACLVHLSARPGILHVMIEDNGVGFDPSDVERPGRRRGLGLLSMRERVSQLRGSMHISSTSNGGTRIEVDLPGLEQPLAVEDAPEHALGDSPLMFEREVGHG